ncbi:TPA: hypothetical protein N0F65_000237 [Lagenidium giganteum]|uniref:Transmembrane protein n=1 Tax=Lagenidium giganteum TaxID=4803 RepID=A0AAV2YGD3_9STRA|nr:TPA: hypothetical protein N0F65_000237 [Lagenidium giganteum]
MIYTFISRVCFSYYASSAKAIYEYWVDIDPLMSNLFNCVNPGIYALMAYLLRRHYLNMSWHTLTKVSVCGSIFTSFVATMLTVFKIIRSPMFTLLMEQLTNFFDAISYYVVIFSIVEVAEPGYESTSYSLITTVANLGIPFAVSLSNMVGSQFTVYDKDLKQDTSKVRWQVAYCYFIMYGLRLLNLLALPLLPKQKKYARELKMFGGSSLLMARIVFGVSGVALFWSLLTTLLSVFASTACLTIAGGEGC